MKTVIIHKLEMNNKIVTPRALLVALARRLDEEQYYRDPQRPIGAKAEQLGRIDTFTETTRFSSYKTGPDRGKHTFHPLRMIISRIR